MMYILQSRNGVFATGSSPPRIIKGKIVGVGVESELTKDFFYSTAVMASLVSIFMSFDGEKVGGKNDDVIMHHNCLDQNNT